jgi:hypothetical protein
MTLLAIKLFLGGMLKRLTAALSALLGWIGRRPWQAAVIALLALSALLWRGNVSRDRTIARMTEQHAKELAQRDAASDANLALAHAQVAALQAKYNEQAKEAQDDYEAASRDADANLARYVAANRVRPDQVCRSNAPAPGEGENPAVPPAMPSDTGMVANRESDLQALVEWTKVGVTAHNDAVRKIEDGTAEPVEWPAPAF